MKFITQKERFLLCTFLRKKLRKCLVVSDIFCTFAIVIRVKARALVQTPNPLARLCRLACQELRGLVKREAVTRCSSPQTFLIP